MITQTLVPVALQPQISYFSSLRRVLIIGPGSLLDQAVSKMLFIRPGLDVFHTSDSNLDSLALKAAQICPDVIILCHIEPTLQTRLIAMLDCISLPEDSMMVIVHPLNTELEVYYHHLWFTADHQALFPLVKGENHATLCYKN
jgi:hypothetical protein